MLALISLIYQNIYQYMPAEYHDTPGTKTQPMLEIVDEGSLAVAISTSQKVVILGGGGREDAIGQAIKDQSDSDMYFGPGNAGTQEYGENLEVFDTGSISQIDPNLVIVGSEKHLATGVTNRLRERGLKVFGPSREAAQLEISKSFAVEFMKRHDIPHPETSITYGYDEAHSFIEAFEDGTYVIKEDGLRGGKGVHLPDYRYQAEDIWHEIIQRSGGSEPVLFQERMHGQEISVFVLSDGKNWTILPYAQDYKRLKDGDEGPNTGGMGAYSSEFEISDHEIVNDKQKRQIEEIVEKTINGMAQEGVEYKGVLYIGVMFAREKDFDPVVIEYNARFGDPEAQVIMPVLQREDVDIYEVLYKTDIKEGLKNFDMYLINKRLTHSALTVCLASEGYPFSSIGVYETVHIEPNVVQNSNLLVHHGEVKTDPYGRKVTLGGRVLYLTGVGDGVYEAAEHVYDSLDRKDVWFHGMQYRKDIGYQLISI